jgi:hypothetical protein
MIEDEKDESNSELSSEPPCILNPCVLDREITEEICHADRTAKYWLSKGDDDKAAQCLKSAAHLRRKTFGSLHPETLANFFSLAMILYRNKEYVEAEIILRNVRSLRRKVFGSVHTLTLRSGQSILFFSSDIGFFTAFNSPCFRTSCETITQTT